MGLDYEALRAPQEGFSPCGLTYNGESCWERVNNPVFNALAHNGVGESKVGSLKELTWNSIHDWLMRLKRFKDYLELED